MNTTILMPALVAAITLATASGAFAQQSERDKAVANFIAADTNGDRQLTLSEFTTLIDLNAASGLGRAGTVKRTGRYRMAFGRIDRDKNGLLTPGELQAVSPR